MEPSDVLRNVTIKSGMPLDVEDGEGVYKDLLVIGRPQGGHGPMGEHPCAHGHQGVQLEHLGKNGSVGLFEQASVIEGSTAESGTENLVEDTDPIPDRVIEENPHPAALAMDANHEGAVAGTMNDVYGAHCLDIARWAGRGEEITRGPESPTEFGEARRG